MKKIGMIGLFLLGGMLSAEPWICDFESGIKNWRITPKFTEAEVAVDADAKYGKVLKITAPNTPAGVNSPKIPIPAGTAGKPWIIEFDLRSEGTIKGSCSATIQYFDENDKKVGQCTLTRIPEGAGTPAWKHYKTTVGTGKRVIPEDAVFVLLRFAFWNQEKNCTGTMVVDNVKVVVPQPEENAFWGCDFESGIKNWRITPKFTRAEVADDADAKYGKVLKITAPNTPAGVNSPKIPIPAGTAGKAWSIEMDLRSEGTIKGSCSAMLQYFDKNDQKVGQCTLVRIPEGKGLPAWKHYKATVGTGKRVIPEDAVSVLLRFAFWNQEKNCTGTIVADNVKIQPPVAE